MASDKKLSKRVERWVILCRSENKLDGKRQWFDTVAFGFACFTNRAHARIFLKSKWGYLKTRPDLQAEPYGWRMPKIVRAYLHIDTILASKPKGKKVKK